MEEGLREAVQTRMEAAAHTLSDVDYAFLRIAFGRGREAVPTRMLAAAHALSGAIHHVSRFLPSRLALSPSISTWQLFPSFQVPPLSPTPPCLKKSDEIP